MEVISKYLNSDQIYYKQAVKPWEILLIAMLKEPWRMRLLLFKVSQIQVFLIELISGITEKSKCNYAVSANWRV